MIHLQKSCIYVHIGVHLRIIQVTKTLLRYAWVEIYYIYVMSMEIHIFTNDHNRYSEMTTMTVCLTISYIHVYFIWIYIYIYLYIYMYNLYIYIKSMYTLIHIYTFLVTAGRSTDSIICKQIKTLSVFFYLNNWQIY
jgi:hypothetical protein